MRSILKLVLRRADRLRSRAGSEARKALLRSTYPGLSVDRDTHVARGCVITCSDGSTMELRGVHLARNVMLKADDGARLRIGKSFIGTGGMVIAAEDVVIGDRCQIAEYVVIRDHDHLVDADTPLDRDETVTTPVAIGDRVWIGAKATVLRGVQVGDDAVIGAHALVTRRVPPGERWAGLPARPLERGSRPDPAGREPRLPAPPTSGG
jgi:acetyltransferase-like isoleucine patch superfamily enzyme